MNPTKIPEGYRKNASGDLVLLSNIKEIDLLRDELVNSIAARALEKSGELSLFRTTVMDEIRSFVQTSADRFRAKMGGAKGNVTLFSFDGRFKVQMASQDYIAFDERIHAAKVLIDKCIKKWSEGSDVKIMALVNDAFQVDQAGNISIRRVLSLRQLDINDRDWKNALDAISESIKVIGSKSYIRVYERDENGEYRPIALDVASVQG